MEVSGGDKMGLVRDAGMAGAVAASSESDVRLVTSRPLKKA